MQQIDRHAPARAAAPPTHPCTALTQPGVHIRALLRVAALRLRGASSPPPLNTAQAHATRPSKPPSNVIIPQRAA
eukprot:7262335-Prymnesium_polylepis.1